MKTAVELSRHIVEIFATEEELNIINQSKLFKQERIYSEEEVLDILFSMSVDNPNDIAEWFEQFKNK